MTKILFLRKTKPQSEKKSRLRQMFQNKGLLIPRKKSFKYTNLLMKSLVSLTLTLKFLKILEN